MVVELDSTEQRAWGALVAVTTRLPGALDSMLQREFGLTHFEYRILAVLDRAPESRMRLGELAVHGHGSLSRLSHVVSKFERVDWARRETNPAGRGMDAVLTHGGTAKVAAATPRYLATVRELVFDGLDGTQKQSLAELGERLSGHLCEVLAVE